MSYYAADQATLGDRIAAARDALGLTQKQLADRLGVRRKTLADWEDDRSEPRANRLHMMSGLLGVSLIWLMTGEGDGLADPETPPRPAPSRLAAEVTLLRAMAATLADRLHALEQEIAR